MTRYSQNGYPACVPSLLRHYKTPGVTINYVMRGGATSTVLLYVVQRWDTEIEPVTSGGCYACRDIIGSETTSNHASGTAVDINPGKHPLGAASSLALRRKVHAILNTVIGGIRVGDVIRWGGDYHSRKDGMHIEINAPLHLVARLAAAILGIHPPVPPPIATPTPESLMEGIVVTSSKAAQFHYTFDTLTWIMDEDHLSRIRGEYKKRYGKDILVTTIGSPATIEQGRYGWLNPTADSPTSAGKEAGWDFSKHRRVLTS